VIGTVLWFNPWPIYGASVIYQTALGLGVLAAVLTIGALVCTLLIWKDGYWSIAGRAYYTLVTVAAVAFVWFLNYWNLLGWQFWLANISMLAGISSISHQPVIEKGLNHA
jgi:hypothetical protein